MKVAKRYKLLVKKINKVLGQPAAVEKPGYSQLLGSLSTPLVDSSSQAADWLQGNQWQQWGGVPSAPGHPPTSVPASPDPLFSHSNRAFASNPGHWLTPDGQWRFKCSLRTSSGKAKAHGISSSYAEQLKVPAKSVVHCRRERQTTSAFLPWEPHEQFEKAKRYDTERWTPQVSRCPIFHWGRVEK